MKRDIYRNFEEWKTSRRRKPLVLNGARQVQKLMLFKHFGKHSYEKMVYLNFEKEEALGEYLPRHAQSKRNHKDFRRTRRHYH